MKSELTAVPKITRISLITEKATKENLLILFDRTLGHLLDKKDFSIKEGFDVDGNPEITIMVRK